MSLARAPGEHPAGVADPTQGRGTRQAQGHTPPNSWQLETLTLPQRLLAHVPRAHLFLLAKQAADGGLDALLLGGLVE